MNLLYGAEISCPLFVLERVCIIEVFLKKIYENFAGTLELSEIKRCPYRGVRLYFSSVIPVLKRFDFLYKLKSVVTKTTKEMS